MSRATPGSAPLEIKPVKRSPTPASPVPLDRGNRSSGHDNARIEDSIERGGSTPRRRLDDDGDAEAIGLDEHDLRDGTHEMERDRRSAGAPLDDDDLFDVDDAGEILERELSGMQEEQEEQQEQEE